MSQNQRKVARGKKKAPKRGFKLSAGVDFSSKYKVANMSYQANRKANLALSMLNTEQKYIDLTAQTPGPSSAGDFVLLNPLSQGTSAHERVGDQVRFKSIDVRLAMANTVDAVIWCRTMIIRDNQPNGAVPTVANLLEDTGGAIQSFRNLDYGKRFKVYYDNVHCFKATSTGYCDQPSFVSIHVDLYNTKKQNIPNITEYGLGNAGTIADISKGAYYLFVITNTATNQPIYSFNSRMKYIDN